MEIHSGRTRRGYVSFFKRDSVGASLNVTFPIGGMHHGQRSTPAAPMNPGAVLTFTVVLASFVLAVVAAAIAAALHRANGATWPRTCLSAIPWFGVTLAGAIATLSSLLN